MKTKITKGKALPISNGFKNLTGIMKGILMLFALFACFNANAHVPPASNIGGPLRAYVNGSNIIVTSQIYGDAAPVISYSFVNNSSGASIVSQGPFQYNKATGVGTQTIVVNPGTAKGSFRISLHVTTAGGSSESSKSVTVINSDNLNNNMLQLGGN